MKKKFTICLCGNIIIAIFVPLKLTNLSMNIFLLYLNCLKPLLNGIFGVIWFFVYCLTRKNYNSRNYTGDVLLAINGYERPLLLFNKNLLPGREG